MPLPGIYVPIKGDYSALEKSLKQAKAIVTNEATGISNALNNALSPTSVRNNINSLVNQFSTLSRASAVSHQSFSNVGVDLKELGKVTGLADKQFATLQSRLLQTKAARAQENALKRIAAACNLTEKEVRELGAQFGVSTSQINKIVGSTGAAEQKLVSFGNTAKAALAVFSTYEIFQFGKAVADTVVHLDSLQRGFAAISGSQKGAAQEMEFLRDVADKTGQNFYNLSMGYQQLTAAAKDSAMEGKKTKDLFLAVAEASSVLGLSQERVDLSIRALGQMVSKGVVQMEELKNQLGDHIPGAVQIAARALGVTTQELYDMSKAGDLLAEDVLPAIAEELHRMYGAAAQTASLESGQSAVNKLSEAWSDFKANIADSKFIIDTIWGITNALRGLNTFIGADLNIEIGMPGISTGSLDSITTKELQLKRVAALQKNIADSEQEISRIRGNANSNGALSDAQTSEIERLTKAVSAHKSELTSLNKVVNNQSPYITGEAAGKIDIAAQAFGHLGFQMQGVREATKAEKKVSEEAHAEMLKYIETQEQAIAKRRDAAMNGARTDEERLAVSKKFEEEMEALQKRRSKGAESAAKSAAKEAEKEQREYQAIIDRLLPLEKAQREYNESLAALDQMDPTKSTERYQMALVNLNREYQGVVENANRYAKAMEDAKQAAMESELSRRGTAIEIGIAQGNMTETEALPFQVALVEEKLAGLQGRLEKMPKSTAEEISAWNSQAEAVANATLELARYQEQLRLMDTAESFKQGLKDFGDSTTREMLDFYGQSLPDAISASSDAIGQFVRDVVQGNATAEDAWTALGKTVENVIYDMMQDMIELSLKMSAMSLMNAGSSSSWTNPDTGFAFGGLMDSLFSMFSANAKGNIYASTGLSAYSNSIVSTPTIFPFAKGIGLMGEEGSEAIMPLTRMRSGDLGVKAEGAGSNVVINVIESPTQGGQQQHRNENGVDVIDVFVSQIKTAVATDIMQGSGVIPAAMARTYGLNRAPGGY